MTQITFYEGIQIFLLVMMWDNNDAWKNLQKVPHSNLLTVAQNGYKVISITDWNLTVLLC